MEKPMPIDPVTGALIGGIGGSLLGGVFGSSAQSKANKANLKLARENRAWMAEMENTSWQRGTLDMIKAGINPMLAVSQGGAGSPSVSAATAIPVDAMARGISSAADKAMRTQELRNLQAIATQNEEKAEQERMNTSRQRVQMGQADVRDEHGNIIQEAQPWFLNDLRQGKSASDLKALEYKIASEIQGYQVNSARAAAQIAEREVDIKELELILKQLDIPEKQALAKWFETVGSASPAAKAVMSIGQWLKFIFNK